MMPTGMDARAALRHAGARRIALAVAALALLVWVLGFASSGLFSGDSGVKLAQAHGLWVSHFTSRALLHDYNVDPTERYFPYGEFKRRVGEHWQGVYSLTFTSITAALVGMLGMTGSLVLASASGVLILIATDRLAGQLGASQPARVAAAIVTVALTPILFYSAQLSEHTPSVGLTILALTYVLGPQRPMLAGVLVALAATMRPECYLAVATIGIALSVRPNATLRQRAIEGAWYVAGALVVLLPYWGFNLLVSDTWDPIVTFQKAATDPLASVRRMLVGDFKGAVGPWQIFLGLAVGAGLARRYHAVARTVAGVALVWLAWKLHQHATGRTLVGMFSLTPIAAYGLAASVWRPQYRAAWLYAFLTTAAIVVFNKSNDAGGLQLGARYVLPALPALIALAVAAIDDDARAKRFPPLLAPAVLAVFTTIMLARSFPTAYRIAAETAAATEIVTNAPGKTVITTVWWHSQVFSPALFENKRIYLIDRPQLPQLLDRLADRGHHEAVFCDHGAVELTLPSGRQVQTVRSRRTPWEKSYFELHDLVISPP